jgi:hypothetical protein
VSATPILLHLISACFPDETECTHILFSENVWTLIPSSVRNRWHIIYKHKYR